MKRIDVRLSQTDISTLSSLCGQKISGIRCDSFESSTAVYGVVGICMGEKAIQFTNNIEVMDYFGALEDVAIFRMECKESKDIHSQIDGGKLIDIPINQRVSRIGIVNERQALFKDGIQTYDVALTRGVIFYFEDGLEVSLEKDIWFSEFISVGKGHDLIEHFSPVEEFTEEWEEGYDPKCTREMIALE